MLYYIPVSYTHLDVYKRQYLYSRPLSAEEFDEKYMYVK